MTKTLTNLLLVTAWLAAQPLLAQRPGDGPNTGNPPEVAFSLPGGFYREALSLNLTAADDATIFFTLDGSKPTEHDHRFVPARPIFIGKTTVIRAFARTSEGRSRTFTQTYFVGENPSQRAVVSVAMSPTVLFDPETGLMRAGPEADLSRPEMPGANFWTHREFGCNVEFFESGGRAVHNSQAGFRIFGGYSRVFPQKSVVLVARKKYGKKFFKHPFFGAGKGKKFRYLVLRNGGSDCQGAHFRDELMTELTEGWDIEKQAYRPALLYLNGKYWGLYHLREKINARFLEDHTDADKDSLDLLEHKQTVREGSLRGYQRMLDFIENNDLADAENYARVVRSVDVENFCDWQVAQIYSANTDAGGNIRYWRAHRPGARWRWILFDTDWGFGLHDPKAWQENSLNFFTDANGPEWPNPPWSTFLFRNLLKNSEFRRLFVNRLCDRLNTCFAPDFVLAKIEGFENWLAPEMPRHLERWDLASTDWQRQVNIIRQFAQKRPAALRQFLGEMFDLGQHAGLEVTAAEGGSVLVNGCVSVEKKNFSGEYFEGVPVELQATAAYGFKFDGWEGLDSRARRLTVKLQAGEPLRVRPIFKPYQHPLHDQVFFNEICTFNKAAGDWVELYNASEGPVQLGGWMLSDRRHEFALPNMRLAPGAYLVVAQDTAAFRQRFPDIQPVVGNFGFGLDKTAEHLALCSADGAAVDSIFVGAEPLDENFTVELIHQKFDNAEAANWVARPGNGSPGAANQLYMAQVVAAQKDFWTRVGFGLAVLVVAMVAFWRRERY